MRLAVCRLSYGAEGACSALLLHERAWRREREREVAWVAEVQVEVELGQSDINGYAGKPAPDQ
jgi:hypothetical protein